MLHCSLVFLACAFAPILLPAGVSLLGRSRLHRFQMRALVSAAFVSAVIEKALCLICS
jgi:hypothetical protein